MKKKEMVPIQFPANLEEMLDNWETCPDENVGWCLLCDGPVRTAQDLIETPTLTIARRVSSWNPVSCDYEDRGQTSRSLQPLDSEGYHPPENLVHFRGTSTSLMQRRRTRRHPDVRPSALSGPGRFDDCLCSPIWRELPRLLCK
jgi:hypothetical protein